MTSTTAGPNPEPVPETRNLPDSSGTSTVVRVVGELRAGGEIPVTALASSLGLSRTSVQNAINLLRQKDLVVDSSLGRGGGAGRPARRYSFNSAAGTVLAADVGAASIRILVSDLAGRILTVQQYDGLGDGGASSQMAALISACRHALATAKLEESSVRAIGVGLPGIVNRAGSVLSSVVLPSWVGVDVASVLGRTFACPVALDNGVRLAADAEHHLGAARGVDDVLYLAVGDRLAMGLIIDGHLRRGFHDLAGDVGRIAFRGVDQVTGRIAWRTRSTGAAVFGAARQGDASARAEVEEFILNLARGIAVLTLSVDPALIVIGGGLSEAGDQLLHPLRGAVSSHLRLGFDIPLVKADLGAAAPVYGALVHAFREKATAIYGVPAIPVPFILPSAMPF